jgi:hypothetical protein
MSRTIKPSEAWAATLGGFRGSFFLRAGALASAAAALMNLAGEVLLVADPDPFHPAIVAAWLLHIVSLWSLGAGFCWVAAHPFLGRSGFLPGVLHAAQGFYLLVLLFGGAPNVIPPVSLTVGRLIALLAFAALERDELGSRAWLALLATAGLQLGKILLRLGGLLPDWGVPLDPALDTLLLVQLAAGLYYVGQNVQALENAWALASYRPRADDFADFNNPEHEWNK